MRTTVELSASRVQLTLLRLRWSPYRQLVRDRVSWRNRVSGWRTPRRFVDVQAGVRNESWLLSALYRRELRSRRKSYLSYVLSYADALTYVKLGALDNLATLELQKGNLQRCCELLDECRQANTAETTSPRAPGTTSPTNSPAARYFERLEDWDQIVDVAERGRRRARAAPVQGDPHRAPVRQGPRARQARQAPRRRRRPRRRRARLSPRRRRPAHRPRGVQGALRSACAATARAGASTSTARWPPAAPSAIATTKAGSTDQRRTCRATPARPSQSPRGQLDVTDTALLLSDVATMLGAGHSIDLLAHRIAAILQSTTLGPRVDVESESGRDVPARADRQLGQPTPTARSRIRLRGSDRRVAINVARRPDDRRDLAAQERRRPRAGRRQPHGRHRERRRRSEPLAARGRPPRRGHDLPIAAHGRTRCSIADPPGRDRPARAHHRRNRHGQGSHRAADPRTQRRRSAARSSPSTARRCRASWSRASCSATAAARSPAPSIRSRASSAPPSAARCSSTKSATSTRRSSRSSCASSRAARSIRSASRARSTSRCASSRRPTPTSISSSSRAGSGATCSTGSASRASRCRRSASARTRFRRSPSLFLTRYARECQRAGLRLGDDFIAALLLYDWPGNIRQLANEIRRVVAMAHDGETLPRGATLRRRSSRQWNARPVATAARRPAVSVRLDQTLAQAIEELERAFIERALATPRRTRRRGRADARPVPQGPVPQTSATRDDAETGAARN